jgi:hypothetical protein
MQSPGFKGALHETLACAWFMSQGYEVFRNVSPHGPVDMIAMRGNEIIKVDVKTASISRKSKEGEIFYTSTKLSQAQIDLGVRILLLYNGVVLGWREDIVVEQINETFLPSDLAEEIYNTAGPISNIAQRFGVSTYHVKKIKLLTPENYSAAGRQLQREGL